MDRHRIAVSIGGVCAFAAIVAAGAAVIVTLAPREKSLPMAKDALLMEGRTTQRPFDEPPAKSISPPSAAPRQDAALAEPPDPAVRSKPVVAGTGRKDEAAAVEVDRPAAAAPASPPRTSPRTVVAALPRTPAVPELSPPTLVPRAVPRNERHADGLLTASEIRRFRLSLRLTREQEPYWPPVEQALVEIGGQQSALARAGQDPRDAFGIGSAMRIFAVARPLLNVLREDQKARVRDQARAMGFGSVASSI